MRLLLGLLLLAACPQPDDDDDSAVGDDDDSAVGDDDDSAPADDDDATPPPDFPPFAFGVEYSEVGLGEIYGEAGVTWTKPRLEAFEWGTSEPDPPVADEHVYDWSCPDAYIGEYQQSGMVDIQAYMSPRSMWGSVDIAPLVNGDVMFAPEFEDDFRLWVRALLERYDGDGVDDMPGLLAPVRYWVVGAEWTGFWPSDDHDDYIRFAEVVRQEALSVAPDSKLGTIPFHLPEWFEGNEPTLEDIDWRIENDTEFMHNSNEGVLAILDRTDLYDYVNLHSLAHYTEVPPALLWFRNALSERGHPVPIWFDDAFPLGHLASAPALDQRPIYPVTDENKDDYFELLHAVARMEEPAYSEALPWIRAEAAKGLIQKVITALGEGAAGIMIGNLEDWMPDNGPELRAAFVGSIGAAAMFGMVDVDHGPQMAICDERFPGDPRPAYRNLELLTEIIGDGSFEGTERIGGTLGVRGYRLERAEETWWVLWSEDGYIQMPGEDEVAESFVLQLPDGADCVSVREAATDMAASTPVAWPACDEGAGVELNVTSTPLILRLGD